MIIDLIGVRNARMHRRAERALSAPQAAAAPKRCGDDHIASLDTRVPLPASALPLPY
jgi:hypothetical protein